MPPQIDLTRLESFVVLAEEQQFTRAAGRLFISQPALSARVSSLERSLGIELIDRRTSRFALTSAGRRLAALGPALLEHEREVVRSLQHAEETHVLRVAATNVGDPHLQATVAYELLANAPQLRLETLSGPTPELLEAVAHRDVEVAVVHLDAAVTVAVPGSADRLTTAVQRLPEGVGVLFLSTVELVTVDVEAAGQPYRSDSGQAASTALPLDLQHCVEVADAADASDPPATVLPGEREVVHHVRLGLGPGVLSAYIARGQPGLSVQHLGRTALAAVWSRPLSPAGREYVDLLRRSLHGNDPRVIETSDRVD